MSQNESSLLIVKNLVKYFPLKSKLFGKQKVHAIDGVSFSIQKAETLAMVGESGSGKTTVGRCILRLLEPTSGEIFFKEKDILKMKQGQFREMRRHIQMVFQDFEASLNPRHTIYRTLREPFLRMGLSHGPEIERAVRSVIEECEMKVEDLEKFPHQLSGGQQQRISIARAIAPRPELIVLDEPISSLDVSIRIQIAELFLSLQERYGLSYLFISHDLSTTKYLAHRIAVMYLGQIVEIAPTRELFQNPLHPYTQALMASILNPDPEKGTLGWVLEGEIPSATNPPIGCRFHSRCKQANHRCGLAPINLRQVGKNHWAACLEVG
jgi:oligopeptide/dipeptide ABC transporter ATP-binding protein